MSMPCPSHRPTHHHYDEVAPEQNPLLDSAEQGPALPGTLFGPSPAEFEAQAAREEAAQRADDDDNDRRRAGQIAQVQAYEDDRAKTFDAEQGFGDDSTGQPSSATDSGMAACDAIQAAQEPWMPEDDTVVAEGSPGITAAPTFGFGDIFGWMYV
jgi:hypothetical protein